MRRERQIPWLFKLGTLVSWPVLLVTLLSGCAVGVVGPEEEPNNAFREEVLGQLIGSSKEQVLERLGSPLFLIKDENKTYFVYKHTVDATGVALVMGLPVPTSGKTLVCSRLEFGERQLLERFDIFGGHAAEMATPGSTASTLPAECKQAFWSEDELAELEELKLPLEYLEYGRPPRVKELEAKAHLGDADAQYTYATQLLFSNAWKWFCLAAHQNHAKAQYKMGGYYHHERPPVTRDLVRAYMWYSLSERNGFRSNLLVDYVWTEGGWRSRDFSDYHEWAEATLTPAEMAEGHRLIAEWRSNPAECEVSEAQAQD